ncbi:secreted aspartic protease 3 [Diutina catenulata]
MKFSVLLSLAAAVVALPSKAPKVLSLDVKYKVEPQLTWFSASSDLDMVPSGTYTVDLQFGSQKDPVTASLDTGSSDLWVDRPLHDVSKSKDAKKATGELNIGYGGGDKVHGPWVLDTVYLGNTKVTDVQFAVVDASAFTNHRALMGVARKGIEGTSEKYDNFPYVLKKNGIINRVAYSLYLNKRQSEKGSIIFGGIDHAKVDGELVKFNSPQTRSAHPWVPTKAFKINGVSHDAKSDYMLDSGSTLSTMDSDLVDEIAKLYAGAKSSGNFYIVDCDQDPSKSFEVVFDGLTIKVPITQFIWEVSGTCRLGAQKKRNEHSSEILGATFLQNVYAVFDWEENTISLAPAKYTDETDIKEIEAVGKK